MGGGAAGTGTVTRVDFVGFVPQNAPCSCQRGWSTINPPFQPLLQLPLNALPSAKATEEEAEKMNEKKRMKNLQVVDTVMIPLVPRGSQELSRCWEKMSQWVEQPLELSQWLLEPLEPSESREQPAEFSQWLEEPQCLSRGLRGATGPVLEEPQGSWRCGSSRDTAAGQQWWQRWHTRT